MAGVFSSLLDEIQARRRRQAAAPAPPQAPAPPAEPPAAPAAPPPASDPEPDGRVQDDVVRELVLDYLVYAGAGRTARVFITEAASKPVRPGSERDSSATQSPPDWERGDASLPSDDMALDASASSMSLPPARALPTQPRSTSTTTTAELSLADLEQRTAFRTLTLRQNVENMLLAGDVANALAECERQCPGIFARDGPNRRVVFELLCQQFIEHIRLGQDKAALTMAQTELADFAYLDAAYLGQLTEIVALLAYSDPAHSPVGGYLQLSRREQVAAATAAAIHRHYACRPYSALERLVRQAVVVRDVLATSAAGNAVLAASGGRIAVAPAPPARFSFADYVASQDSADPEALWRPPT